MSHTAPGSATEPASMVLVVDLDGTLLRSDMLHESFWSAVSKDWRSELAAMSRLPAGRAQLKTFLAEQSAVEVGGLPYDEGVIALIRDWRSQGGRTALVTATDQRLAKAIGEELGLFDEVHGSDGLVNLKGKAKADFLVDRFGQRGFAYAGDHRHDLPVWEQCALAITVNAPAALRGKVDRLVPEARHIDRDGPSIRHYVRSLRVHQWLKNLLVFAPMLAAHDLRAESFLAALLAFLAFSMVASSTYLINDLLDLNSDRAHYRKRFRPLAAGEVPISHACVMAVAGLVGGVALAAQLPGQFAGWLALYLVLTLSYSLLLKRHPVIDICVLAGLYTLRLIAGAVATGTLLSPWLLAFSMFLFFSLAAVKRQTELVSLAQRELLTISGRGYHAADLPVIASAAIASGFVSVLVLALYLTSPDVQQLYTQPELLLGVCCIELFWVTRVVLLAHRGELHHDPVVFAVTDRVSQLCGAIAALIILVAATL